MSSTLSTLFLVSMANQDQPSAPYSDDQEVGHLLCDARRTETSTFGVGQPQTASRLSSVPRPTGTGGRVEDRGQCVMSGRWTQPSKVRDDACSHNGQRQPSPIDDSTQPAPSTQHRGARTALNPVRQSLGRDHSVSVGAPTPHRTKFGSGCRNSVCERAGGRLRTRNL